MEILVARCQKKSPLFDSVSRCVGQRWVNGGSTIVRFRLPFRIPLGPVPKSLGISVEVQCEILAAETDIEGVVGGWLCEPELLWLAAYARGVEDEALPCESGVIRAFGAQRRWRKKIIFPLGLISECREAVLVLRRGGSGGKNYFFL